MYKNIFISDWTDTQESMVYLWDDAEGLSVLPYKMFNYAYIRHHRGEYTSIYGESLRRLDNFRYGSPNLYESDVPRETKVLTDVYLDSDIPSTGHCILTFDIEVDSVGGFAKTEVADKEITSIANHNSLTDHYTVFLLDKAGRVKTYTKDNVTIISCVNEYVLIRDWLEFYKDLAPSIVTGWNIDFYDIPYLFNRITREFGRATAQQLSPVGIVRYNSHSNKYQIAGVSCLDYLALYRKYTYTEQPNYRLDTIGKIEVDIGKVEYEGTLDMLFENDIEKFIEYNLNDVKIVVAIDRKMKLIELIRFICHLGHVPYEDFEKSSKFIEGTIITYLHRKGIICANKPEGGMEKMAELKKDNTQGFAGAFVKEPFPGRYEWVYSLDLQSLYPSIIMSLNISPDTKRGRVSNWDLSRHMTGTMERYAVELIDRAEPDPIQKTLSKAQFDAFLINKKLSISSNGILYRTDKVGIIPEILDTWFKQRVEFKNKMKELVKAGDTEQADFYDRRQHVQKILLNSIYGVLGLPIFRFYDVDNALAVTATGQDVIKTSAKYLNSLYKKAGAPPKDVAWVQDYQSILDKKKDNQLKAQAEDWCLYIDTDSVYFSAVPLFDMFLKENPVTPCDQIEEDKQLTIQIAREHEAALNKFYNTMAKKLFNCDSHRFVIKGESIIKAGLWVGKKMYAMRKVYDLETNQNVDKLAFKGLAVVRSSTPPAFAKFMKSIIDSIIENKPKADVDRQVLEFREALDSLPYEVIARNTSVKTMTKFEDASITALDSFVKGTPAHYKAAITYNRLLEIFEVQTKNTPILNGEKIKWVYLKKNPFGIESVALKMYDDPQQIIDIVKEYIDYDLLFEKELANKLEDFYSAMKWGLLPTSVNQNAFAFFDFE